MALSDTSSSSSSDSKTGLCAALPTATSSLNDVTFLLPALPLSLFTLSESALVFGFLFLLRNRLSSELSSSPDDVPMVNIGPFFLGCAWWYEGEVLRIGVGCAARLVCDR